MFRYVSVNKDPPKKLRIVFMILEIVALFGAGVGGITLFALLF